MDWRQGDRENSVKKLEPPRTPKLLENYRATDDTDGAQMTREEGRNSNYIARETGEERFVLIELLVVKVSSLF